MKEKRGRRNVSTNVKDEQAANIRRAEIELLKQIMIC